MENKVVTTPTTPTTIPTPNVLEEKSISKPVMQCKGRAQCRSQTALQINKYFCVNLPRRKDRFEFIQKEIQKSEILKNNIKIWVGFDGKEINPEIFPNRMLHKSGREDITYFIKEKKARKKGLTLTPGGLGFYLTHAKIFEYCIENNEIIFVMDDDIEINKNFDEELQEILNELPNDFDFCYLGYYDTPYKKIEYSKKLFIPEGQFCGPNAYLVSPKGAKKILDRIFPMYIQLDSRLYILQKEVSFYAAQERLVTYTEKLKSDIQNL